MVLIKYLISTLFLFGIVGSASACNTVYNITLQTFGEGVLVELRSGTPGNSRVVQSRRSNGGAVNFGKLCPGNYFLAIGNDDSVSGQGAVTLGNGIPRVQRSVQSYLE